MAPSISGQDSEDGETGRERPGRTFRRDRDEPLSRPGPGTFPVLKCSSFKKGGDTFFQPHYFHFSFRRRKQVLKRSAGEGLLCFFTRHRQAICFESHTYVCCVLQ